MKKYMQFISAVLGCILLLSASGITASAAYDTAQGYDSDDAYKCGVYDEKGLFDKDKISEFNEYIQEVSRELELYIAVILSDTKRSDSSTEVFADEIYDEIFGADSDGVLYYMDLSETGIAYDYISTAGKGMLLYDDHIDSMFEKIDPYLPRSGEPVYDYEIESAIMQIIRIFEDYGDKKPGFLSFEYDEYTGKYIYYKNGKTVVSEATPPAIYMIRAFISSIIGIIAAIICYFTAKKHYKFKPSCSPNVYISRQESRFNRRDDIFISTHTSRVRIESSSGGGGGGGSSHGGGGGSHGGGGHHR